MTGRGAHAGLEPERGVNAASELTHQMLAIQEIAETSPPGVSLTPTIMGAGTTANTVPAAGRLIVDVRAVDKVGQQHAEDALTALRPRLPGASLQVHRRMWVPPLEASSSAELFRRARQVAATLGLGDLQGLTVGGASDGNKTAAHGVPTLDGLGAVGGGAHGDDEHVLVNRLADRAALLSGLIDALRADQPAQALRTGDQSRLGNTRS